MRATFTARYPYTTQSIDRGGCPGSLVPQPLLCALRRSEPGSAELADLYLGARHLEGVERLSRDAEGAILELHVRELLLVHRLHDDPRGNA